MFLYFTKTDAASITCYFKRRGEVIALIKPQFEAGREAVGKNGIVRDPQTHQKF